jgi:hypothetical protein
MKLLTWLIALVWIINGLFCKVLNWAPRHQLIVARILIAQVIVVGVMNGIEFFMAPDLLLFGRGNIILALVFMTIVYFNEFFLHAQKIGV